MCGALLNSFLLIGNLSLLFLFFTNDIYFRQATKTSSVLNLCEHSESRIAVFCPVL